MRVLVVEDEEVIRQVLAELLADTGHEVVFGSTYPEAAALLDAGHWDMLLVDKMLPGGDGVALAEAARTRGLRVVVCSGVPLPAVSLAARGIGVLQKPFKLAELLDLIDPPA